MSTESALKMRLLEDVKTAMKAQEKRHLGILRLITAAIKQKEVDERISLSDAQVVAVLDKMVKQRRDSISHYLKANREDLAIAEEEEIHVISHYLPQPLDEATVNERIKEAITKVAAVSIKDMGKVMALLKEDLQGKVDFKIVSEKIKKALSS